MHNISRRSLIAYGLVSAQGMLAACGGGEGGSEAVAATGTAAPTASPTPGTAGTPTASPAPAPAPTPAPTPTPAPPPAAPAVWDVGPALRLVADAATRFDLSITLPAAVRRGGVFKLAAGSAALPAGVTLDPSGILLASASAGVATVAGLVFTYDEP